MNYVVYLGTQLSAPDMQNLVLLISLVLDVSLLVSIAIKSKYLPQPLRFAAFLIIINLFAHYIIRGLSESFRYSILLTIICAATAKIFVLYTYITSTINKKSADSVVYMLVIALSLFTSNTPFFGIISGVILIAYLFYVEYMGKNEISYSKNDTSELNETSLYMRIIEENYQKSRELWHDLNNHIVSMRSLVDNKEYADLEVYINSLSEKIADNAFPIKSGNIILDALIADKYRIAKKHGIFVEFESIDYRNIIEAEDLCVIVGNLFDNAIEGNVRSICNEDRYIKLRISSVSDSLIITLKNPLFHELVVKSGLPVYSQARFRPSWHGT